MRPGQLPAGEHRSPRVPAAAPPPLRLLVLSGHAPDDLTHGVGLLVANTLRVLREDRGVAVTLGLLLSGDDGSWPPGAGGAAAFVHYRRPESAAVASLRATFGAPPSGAERRFLRDVADQSAAHDAALWFGLPGDVVSVRLPAWSRAPVVFHVNDSISLFQALRAAGVLRRLKAVLARRLERTLLGSSYAGAVYVSHADAHYVQRAGLPSPRTRVLALPNGVDARRFRPGLPAGGPTTLLLVGVMDFVPNVDAARRLVEDVLPLVRSDVRVRLVGKHPTPAVLALAQRDPRVTVTGAVDDVVAEYQGAHLLVAPIEIATGTKNKVLEALACGVPVLTTRLVADAFGEALPGVVVATTPVEFARAVDDLAGDDDRRAALGAAGRRHVVARMSWEGRTRVLVDWVREVST